MHANPFAGVISEIERVKTGLTAKRSEPATKEDVANALENLHEAMMVCYRTWDPQAIERFVRDIVERRIPNTTGRKR